ncbi:MAG: hypothetical protein R3C71_07510 [Candidatus Krumholzibacteriia bacterium]|nr:hypothetical protein [bacterium]
MKTLLAAALLLVALSGVAVAQSEPFIGIYDAPEYVRCHADIALYTSVTVYFLAYLPPPIQAMTAAEFRVSNLPDATMAVMTPFWGTDLVIGDLGYGLALAWSPPLPGPVAQMGSVSFFSIQDFGDDYRIVVEPSLGSGNLIIVDENFDEIHCDLVPMWFTFNCTGSLPYGCDCPLHFTVATEESSWGQIKALY